MSLKAFHVFFVTICLIFSIGIGVWGVREYRLNGETQSLAFGIGSFVAAVVLTVYGLWFIKKLRNISYI